MSLRIGVIFPGQGSQNVGMGMDVAHRALASKKVFERARQVLGYDLLALQSHGPEERLRETQFSQPAIFVTNIAIYQAAGDALRPVVSAGHSFGEICSLTVSGALDFEEALQIVDERGKAMQFAADRAPGGMSAVLGLEAQTIRDVVERINAQKHLRL
ncbi:MAG: ACP S-malonyltransferase [Candidatus Baltobacteraceae bacterium]